MRTLTPEFVDASFSDSVEPVLVAKIINSTNTIYLTTRNITITDPGSIQIQGIITAASFAGQTIRPEDGISSIGGMSIKLIDRAREFTTELNTIDIAGGSLLNNKVEIYVGYADIDFADYVLWMPLYIASFGNDELTYTLILSDTQRISKKTLFSDLHVTELVGNYGYANTSTVEVLSTADFPLVEHNADWLVDPSETIGYLKIYGISQDNREVKEVISYTGFTGTEFTGVKRGRFGTERVNLNAVDSDDNPVTVELTEMVYIDLVQPAMVIALLTGDLYGQPGKTLPDNWHAGLSPSLVSLTSIENIGGDLWQEHIEFRDPEDDDAKGFITEQCLTPYGTFFRIDQNGEYSLARYDYLSSLSPAVRTLEYDKIISVTPPNRSAKGIYNVFKINWEWRVDGDYYARDGYYFDAISQTKYQYNSPIKEIDMLGLRNRDKTSKPTLDFVAQSQVKRLSNPSIRRTVTTKLKHVIDLEVGDTLALVLANEPDYRTLTEYSETFEIQGINVDFLSGNATLSLFASEGTPSQFIIKDGSNVVDIDHTGWTNLEGSGYGSAAGGVFTFNNGANLPSGRYYYDGDIDLPDNYTITINGSCYIDCANYSQGVNAKIDGAGNGVLNDTGYFGGGDVSQGGIETEDTGFFTSDKIWYRGGESDYVNGRIWVDLPSVLRVENGQSITGLIPDKLYGSSGGAGGNNALNGIGTVTGSQSGGLPAKGGAGLFLSCDAMQYQSSSVIDLSGADNNHGGSAYRPIVSGPYAPFDQYFHAGSSGFGWPGVCVVALKDRNAVKPFLYDLVVAKSGAWSEPARVNTSIPDKRVTGGSTSKKGVSAAVGDYYPRSQGGTSFANTDFATAENRSAIHVMNLIVADDHVPEPGVDTIGSADAPTLSAVERLNTPRTPLGNQSTFEVTATPAVGDVDFRYVLFEYRLLGQAQWIPIAYDVTTETTFTVTSSGDTYEIRATAYNAADQPGGQAVIQATTTLVERDSETSAGGEPGANDDITLPDIRGLELVNRIDNGDNWNQWKSPNAEFRWLKMSNTLPAGLDNLNGATDLHLEGYKIRITDTDGNVVREEVVKDSFYTYTYDKNKKDNPTPIRAFTFEVQAVSTTGYVSEYTGFEVANPAPAAPSAVVSSAGFTSIEVVFTLPTDVDFVGVDAYLMPGTGDPYTAGEVKRVSGNSVVWDNLAAGATYTFGLRSVDQFGTGGQITATGVQTRLIESSALGDITTPVVIDETGGRLITNNSGYIAFHGATSVPAESSNPLIFGAFDGSDYPFWIDAGGQMKLEALAADSAISVGSSTFGNAGFQVQNNSGSPRLNIGDGTPETSIQFENSALTVGDDVALIGVDGYDNDGLYYYHGFGFEIQPIMSNSSLSGSSALISSSSSSTTSGLVITGSGDRTDVTNGMAWKSRIQFNSAATVSNVMRVGQSVGSFTDAFGFSTFFYFDRESGYRVRGGFKDSSGAVTYGSFSSISAPILNIECVYDPILEQVEYYIDVTGVRTLIWTKTSVVVTGIIGTLLLLELTAPSYPSDPVSCNIYDYKVKSFFE